MRTLDSIRFDSINDSTSGSLQTTANRRSRATKLPFSACVKEEWRTEECDGKRMRRKERQVETVATMLRIAEREKPVRESRGAGHENNVTSATPP